MELTAFIIKIGALQEHFQAVATGFSAFLQKKFPLLAIYAWIMMVSLHMI